MKEIRVRLTFIDQIDEGFDNHLQNGETWAYEEYQRRLKSRLGATTLEIDDIDDSHLVITRNADFIKNKE